MSKDRNIDDTELANISGAGAEKELQDGGGSGGAEDRRSGGDPGVPGDPTNPNTDDQDGDNNTFG